MTDADDKIRCDACPVMCYIRPGMTGACDRYANQDSQLVRVDPHVLLDRAVSEGGKVVPFVDAEGAWSGDILKTPGPFVTAVGAGTTYPDYKPAPFIVSSKVDGVDMVTVVTEGIYSYCGVKLKIDTDRHLGAECATVRAEGEPVGHVTTGEYGSQMLSLGGVNHLTHGGKKEGRVTCETLLDLCNGRSVELLVDGGATVIVEAGKAPIINGKVEERMRVGCGSATIGMFAKQWGDKVDEVVVVDDHITGVLSEHQAGKLLGMRDTGIKMKGRRSTPGRYFHVAEPGTGWGGTNISDPLDIVAGFNPKVARSGMTMLMVSTTGEQYAFYRLDEDLRPVEAELPENLRQSVERISENCEPALCSVLFMAGAGGSLRAGVTENPVRLTRSVRQALTTVTAGGAPVTVWPGGGITFMVDVTLLPKNAFGYVPTPAIVAPIEFTLRLDDYAALGGHVDEVRPLDEVVAQHAERPNNYLHERRGGARRGHEAQGMRAPPQQRRLPDGRLHLHDGPIDLIIEAFGETSAVEAAYIAAWRRFATILDELCAELPLLRAQAGADGPAPRGPVARRMAAAVAPFLARRFITPMAAVAGAVAEEVLEAMASGRRLARAYVNDGGDIALHLGPGETFSIGMVDRPDRPNLFGRATIGAADRVRGVATSGWRGRSFSLGVADAVTVLAASAARADAAATLIANAVDIPGHPAIERAPARDLDPQSDLGERRVTIAVGPLTPRRNRARARLRRGRG